MSTTDTQDVIDAQTAGVMSANDPDYYIMTREHPYYRKMKSLWRKATYAYNGGRTYIEKTLKKHPSETDDEFTDRKAYSYNINLIEYSTNRFGDYIFSKPPRRINAPKEIVEDFDRMGKSANTVMREVFDHHTIYGLSWIFVDMPPLVGDAVNLKTKQDSKIRPWANAVAPMDVPDWDFDQFGDLNWILREEMIVEKKNPRVKPVVKRRRTLYTKEYWQTYDVIVDNGDGTIAYPLIEVSPIFRHSLGKVPVIAYTSVLYNRYFNHPKIDDILTIHDAVLNGESELLTNIIKQTYGQLVLPSSVNSMVSRIKMRLAENDNKINFNDPLVQEAIVKESNVILSRTKHIAEDAEERGTARYIQPEGSSITGIITHNDRLMNVMMKLYGFLVGVDTTQRSSAESKSVDNVSLAAQLASIAGRLQEMENKIWTIFAQFDSSIKAPKIEYNTNYDIHELKAVIASIVELVNINAGPEYQKQTKRTCVRVLDTINRIPDNVYEKIEKEIESNTSADAPITFAEQAAHQNDASGSRPDSVTASSSYDKSKTANVSTTEKL